MRNKDKNYHWGQLTGAAPPKLSTYYIVENVHCTLETTADKSWIFTVYTYSSELLDLMWFQCGHLAVIGIFGLSSMGEE